MTAPAFTNTTEFSAFKASFSGDVVLPGDDAYEGAIRRWSASAERPAGVIAYVKTDEDVSLAIGFAVKAGLEIAVKGGGHNPSGASSSDGGMVIDLSRYMKTATCDPDTQVVTVGGGALWADVDKATIAHGLATVCGTVSHTGVGGLTVGGGFGHLTGQRGLVVDNLVGATVVLADGTIVHASDHENDDLFWGIRGGGINFGVVTTFELKCYPQAPEVFCGMLLYTPDKVEAVLRAADKFDREEMGAKKFFLSGMLSTPMGIMVIVVLSHNGPSEEGRRKYKAFYDLGPIKDDTGFKPYIQLNQIMDEEQAHGTHLYMCAANQVVPPPDCVMPIYEQFCNMIAETPEFQGSLVAFEFIPNDVVRSKPDDATAYNCRNFSNNALIIVKWKNDDGTGLRDKARAYAKTMTKLIDPGQGESQTPYGNYGTSLELMFESDVVTGGDKVKKLFGTNYPRLQKIKAKYDPNLVFNKWFPITPAA